MFENFRGKCSEIYAAHFLSLFHFLCTKISMTNSLKKDKSKIKLFTDIDMLLMVEKGIKGGI